MPEFGQSWQGTVIITPDPAAGAELVYTATSDLLIYALYGTLVTSATVANRRVHLVADDGANIYFRSPSGTDITASLTEPISAFSTATVAANGGVITVPLPGLGLRLPTGYRLRTITTGLDATDNYSAFNLLAEILT